MRTDMPPRFKIDSWDSSYLPFALYRKKPKWHAPLTGACRWEMVESFENRDLAAAFYEKIKNLPEYLD
jgi:hypothetical protein